MSVVTWAEVRGAGPWGSAAFVLTGPAAYSVPGRYGAALQAALPRVAENTARRLKTGAQQGYHAYPAIAAGFQQLTSTRGGTIVAGLVNTHPVFPFREYDTRPHTIAARRVPYLHFKGRDGRWVRVVSVAHPGTKGLYAVARLFAAEEDRFVAALLDAAEAALDA